MAFFTILKQLTVEPVSIKDTSHNFVVHRLTERNLNSFLAKDFSSPDFVGIIEMTFCFTCHSRLPLHSPLVAGQPVFHVRGGLVDEPVS